MSAPAERCLVFQCEGAELLGILHEPAAQAGRIGVMIVVGGPQYRVGSHRQFVLMARSFARSGLPVFRFDYRGMGDSDGATRTFESVDADLRAAIDVFVAQRPELQGVVLCGLCDAASATLMYGANDRRIRGLVLMNPWVRTTAGEARAYLRHYYLRRLVQPSFWRKVLTGGFNPFKSARELAGTVGQAGAAPAALPYIERMLAGLRAFMGPVLVLISEHDLTAREFVDLCAGDRGWRAATTAPHVKLIRLDGADHTFSSRAALEKASAQCSAWLASPATRLLAG
jgi:exosortase A-associated hydrolase 1